MKHLKGYHEVVNLVSEGDKGYLCFYQLSLFFSEGATAPTFWEFLASPKVAAAPLSQSQRRVTAFVVTTFFLSF